LFRVLRELSARAASSPVELVVITDTVAAAARAADIRWLAEEMRVEGQVGMLFL